MQRVTIKQRYWLDEKTEGKLQQLGAVLVDEVIVTDHYYDNDRFDLAMNQIWLSQRDHQWELIIGLPKSDSTIDANEEHPEELVSKSETTRSKDRRQHVDCLISSEYNGSSPRLKTQNKAQTSGKEDNEWEEGNTMQEHQTPTAPQQRSRMTSSESGAHAEPGYTHNELKAHRQIIEYIAQFLEISLTKEEESIMKINQFFQLAKIHHYASCHMTKRRTYKLQDTYRIVIDKDELAPRISAVMCVDVDVSNIIKELEKIEEIAAHLKIDLCQTNQILA